MPMQQAALCQCLPPAMRLYNHWRLLCLFAAVCKSYRAIFSKFGENAVHGTQKKPLDVSGNLDHKFGSQYVGVMVGVTVRSRLQLGSDVNKTKFLRPRPSPKYQDQD